MRNEWQRTSVTVDGYKAIMHKTTRELCLAGSRGEVWPNNDQTYSAVLRPGNHQRNALKVLGTGGVGSKESEMLISFDKTKLVAILKVIKYSVFPTRQIRFANSF